MGAAKSSQRRGPPGDAAADGSSPPYRPVSPGASDDFYELDVTDGAGCSSPGIAESTSLRGSPGGRGRATATSVKFSEVDTIMINSEPYRSDSDRTGTDDVQFHITSPTGLPPMAREELLTTGDGGMPMDDRDGHGLGARSPSRKGPGPEAAGGNEKDISDADAVRSGRAYLPGLQELDVDMWIPPTPFTPMLGYEEEPEVHPSILVVPPSGAPVETARFSADFRGGGGGGGGGSLSLGTRESSPLASLRSLVPFSPASHTPSPEHSATRCSSAEQRGTDIGGSMQSLLSASGGLSGGQSGGRSRCSSRHRQDVFRLNYAVRAIVLGKKNSLRHWLQMHDRSNSDHLHLVAKDSLGGTLLHYAAWFNAPEMAQLLITYGADPNVKTWYDTTPLHVACYKGHTDIAQMLIDDGADTDAPLTCGWSPLHLATHRRQFKTIRQLVENKANPSVAVENGITPLHLAADWGQLNLVRSIISLNVDPNVTAEYNQLTPLHLACEQNHYKVVEYLINARANPNVFTSYSGATPLHVACRNGSHEIVSLLLRNGADIKLRDTQGFTAVHYALKSNSIHVLKCLLSDWSLPPNCTIGTDDQKHMLQDACEHGHEKAVELLLKWNASPDIVDAHGRTAVHYAAASGNTYIINHLDKAGAHLQNLDSYLDTPLHLACKNGHLNAVQSLVERGLKLDSLNETRKTPLYLASSVGHSNIVEYLINKGASVNLKDHKGFNCLDVAIEKENKEVVMAIIRSRQWKNALRNSRQDVQGNGETTPFRRMILKMPDLAEIVMNRCIQTNSTIQLHSSMHIRPDHKDYRVTFNYEFLDDARCPFGKVHPWASPKLKQTGHPLYVISNKERYLHLLRHPLIQRLVLFKWRQYAVRFAMANIVLYAVFLLFLTAYALSVPKPFDEMCNQAKNHSRNTSAVDCEDLTPLRRHFLNTAFVVIYTNGFLRLFSEAVQLYQLGIHYFFDWVNFVENGLYIFSLVFAYPFGDGDECYCLSVFQWKVGVLVMLTAWCVILLLLENTYTIGVYVLMFRTIIRTFVRVILLGAFILCGFAISFVMIFEQPKCDTFTTLHNGIVTTITMFSGELNYDNFLQATCHHPFLDVALIVWVLFVILITILLANMLVGLAVGDVKDILDKSTLRRTKLQVDLILTIDAVLPSKFLPSSATVWEEDLEPNEYKLNSQLFEKYKWWRALLVILKGKIFTWGQLGVEIEPDELEQHAMTTELVQESQRFSKELRYELRKGLKDHTCRMQQREKAQVEKSAQDFRKHTQSVSATQRLEFERFCKPMFSAVTDQLNEMREAISELKLQLHDKSKPSAKEQ